MSIETQATIFKWANETFGQVTSNIRAATRLNEEVAELLAALATDDSNPKVASEIADVAILLYRIASAMGIDVHQEVDLKMAINKQREWNLDGTGHGYHK